MAEKPLASGSDSEAGSLSEGEADRSSDSVLPDRQATNAGRGSDDSSDDERPSRNTVGDIPIEWYKDEDHIGYDREGGKLAKQKRRDRLEALLARNDSSKDWRTFYDEYDEEITLTKSELQLLQRVREGHFPHIEIDPFEPENDWFTRHPEPHPLISVPKPKSSFTQSKWEAKKVVKLVRALRKGWLKPLSERQKQEQEPATYLMWQDDGLTSNKTANGLAYIPAPKPQLPGHEESYHPPEEYLPTEEERRAWELMDAEDRPPALPQNFDSLRGVPAYDAFIKERFERCLDLYLCPRTRRQRPLVKDPDSLVPQLPAPRDLRPFPHALMLRYLGHAGSVHSIAPDPTGQWLASGGQDGMLRVWEVSTGRLVASHLLSSQAGSAVCSVAWCPDPALRLLSAASGSSLFLLASGVGTEEQEAAAAQALARVSEAEQASTSGEAAAMCRWVRRKLGSGDLVELVHQQPVTHVAWHGRGDYFASVVPTGNTQAVLVHQLSRQLTQNPFRKVKGRLVAVEFHPAKPFFFVATYNNVRVYNLAKQALAKKLQTGSGIVSSLAVHPSGDHIIVGTEDKRLAWFDMDLSTRPYRVMRYHTSALTGVAFHRTYPLFASSSTDASVHVFHGMVYQDLMTNPLIVPVKVLRGFQDGKLGSNDCKFHPTQPWVFVAGADGVVYLFGDQ